MVPASGRKVTRIGVYAIAKQQGKILLTMKRSGCYKGLLDLPGGGIEFGENPFEALVRELKEEVAMAFDSHHLLDCWTHVREVADVPDPFIFHQIGIIYHVEGLVTVEGIDPEEQFAWYGLDRLYEGCLTPFAMRSILECGG